MSTCQLFSTGSSKFTVTVDSFREQNFSSSCYLYATVLFTSCAELQHSTLHYPPPHCTRPSTSVWAHFHSWLSASHIPFNIRSVFVDLLCRAPRCESEVETAGSWISKELCLHESFIKKSFSMFIMFHTIKKTKSRVWDFFISSKKNHITSVFFFDLFAWGRC